MLIFLAGLDIEGVRRLNHAVAALNLTLATSSSSSSATLPSPGGGSEAFSPSELHAMQLLLRQTALLWQRQLLRGLRLHRETLKLSHVLACICSKILAKGFCRRPDEAEEGEGEDEDDVAGTGMGEGQGKKDVSNEIEDEEQLTGTKGAKHTSHTNTLAFVPVRFFLFGAVFSLFAACDENLTISRVVMLSGLQQL